MIKHAAPDCDLRVFARGQRGTYRAPIHADEFDRRQFPVGRGPDVIRHTKSLQDRPAARIQTVAADFFAGKDGALEQERAQTGLRAKGRATRARRTAPHDGDIPHFRVLSHGRAAV